MVKLHAATTKASKEPLVLIRLLIGLDSLNVRRVFVSYSPPSVNRAESWNYMPSMVTILAAYQRRGARGLWGEESR